MSEPRDKKPTHDELMSMMSEIQKYWVTASGEPELKDFAEYVLGLVNKRESAYKADLVSRLIEKEKSFIAPDGKPLMAIPTDSVISIINKEKQ